MGVNSNGHILLRTGINKGNAKGSGWDTSLNDHGEHMSHVTMCDNGRIWAVNAKHFIYMRGDNG